MTTLKNMRFVPPIILGVLGGIVFWQLKIPLPFMLGAMTFGFFVSLTNIPIENPKFLLNPMRAVLGMFLGSAVTPGLLSLTPLIGTVMLIPFIIVVSLLGMLLFNYFTHMDKRESFFGAVPGGIFTMIAYAEDMKIPTRNIALIHAARLFLVVFCVPFLVRWWLDAPLLSPEKLVLDFTTKINLDTLWLLLTLLGWPIARMAKIPGAPIMGPLILSGVLHIAGIITAHPPEWVIFVSQIVLGVSVGLDFKGAGVKAVLRSFLLAAGLVAMALVVMVIWAYLMINMNDTPFSESMLAFAPGGLSEMSLIAYSLDLDVGYVVAMQSVRIALISIIIPPVVLLLFQKNNQ